MKVYIMYEVAGTMGHVDPGGDDKPETRKAVTQEVNAAIEGASEAGATEFVVNTGSPFSHVILEDLDPRAELIKGGWKPSQTMEGLDDSFDAQLILSMHAMVGTPRAVFAHSWSFAIHDFRVNGKSVGELGMAVYFAAACGVPTLMVSGDTATCREAEAFIPGIEVAPTKDSITWISARCPHPSIVLETIRSAAKRAVERKDEFKPLELKNPVTIDIEMISPNAPSWWEWIPTVERTGPCSIRYQAEDYVAAHRLFLILSKVECAWGQESGLWY